MKRVIQSTLYLIICYVMTTSSLFAQEADEYKVAIFLYDGVELLDFSGPGEVFGVTSGFDVYTISTDGEEILSQGFVTVKPEYSIQTAPAPDIIVFPGGGTGPTSQNPEVLNWIRTLANDGTMTMSVCTGANILAKAGLLDGLNVTTWYGFTGRLQEMLPNSIVHEDTRFVDSGNIITTAGVSAGIDGALHMVSRIKGLDEAKATAQYMEYDKWVPEDGMIDYKNAYIEKIKTQGLDQALQSYPVDLDTGRPDFYEGEMKNLAMELTEIGRTYDAISVLELNVKAYPNSIGSYKMLSGLYEETGRFAPPTQEEFINMLVTEGKVQDSIELYKKVRNEYPGWKITSEGYLNWAGYQYLQKGVTDHAIEILKLNVETYPKSANVYDSLGEAYLKRGEREMARQNYQKALSINPNLETAKNALAGLTQ
ncbi:MAG: DJ-1/PfpI family protein [Balneolales bacterium]